MARFRAEMDGSTRHLDADRLVIDDVVRLERRHGDSWITVVSMDPSEVTSVSRRHTELNGSWSWVRVYPATRTQQRRTVPTWEYPQVSGHLACSGRQGSGRPRLAR